MVRYQSTDGHRFHQPGAGNAPARNPRETAHVSLEVIDLAGDLHRQAASAVIGVMNPSSIFACPGFLAFYLVFGPRRLLCFGCCDVPVKPTRRRT